MAGGEAVKETPLMSPYTIQTNENSSQVLSPILLNGSNYERWSKLMTNALRSKRKLGFINGTLKIPTEGTDDAERWDMVNSLVIGWIYASVEPKLRSSISLVDEASAMWTSIKARFSVDYGTREHQLHEDIRKTRQERQTVEDYYGKLKVLWDDLSDLDKGFVCCCKQSSCQLMIQYQKKRDGIRTHQFLMGLDNLKPQSMRVPMHPRVRRRVKAEFDHLSS